MYSKYSLSIERLCNFPILNPKSHNGKNMI